MRPSSLGICFLVGYALGASILSAKPPQDSPSWEELRELFKVVYGQDPLAPGTHKIPASKL